MLLHDDQQLSDPSTLRAQKIRRATTQRYRRGGWISDRSTET